MKAYNLKAETLSFKWGSMSVIVLGNEKGKMRVVPCPIVDEGTPVINTVTRSGKNRISVCRDKGDGWIAKVTGYIKCGPKVTMLDRGRAGKIPECLLVVPDNTPVWVKEGRIGYYLFFHENSVQKIAVEQVALWEQMYKIVLPKEGELNVPHQPVSENEPKRN